MKKKKAKGRAQAEMIPTGNKGALGPLGSSGANSKGKKSVPKSGGSSISDLYSSRGK